MGILKFPEPFLSDLTFLTKSTYHDTLFRGSLVGVQKDIIDSPHSLLVSKARCVGYTTTILLMAMVEALNNNRVLLLVRHNMKSHVINTLRDLAYYSEIKVDIDALFHYIEIKNLSERFNASGYKLILGDELDLRRVAERFIGHRINIDTKLVLSFDNAETSMNVGAFINMVTPCFVRGTEIKAITMLPSQKIMEPVKFTTQVECFYDNNNIAPGVRLPDNITPLFDIIA